MPVWSLRGTLHVAAHSDQAGLEPSDDLEPVQHMAGVAEPHLDRGLVRRRAVGHHDLHGFAPSMPLGSQKAAQSLGVAVGHHGEHLAGVAVDDHRHVAVPLADRGPLHPQHPASLPAAVLAGQQLPAVRQIAAVISGITVAAVGNPDRWRVMASAEICVHGRCRWTPPYAVLVGLQEEMALWCYGDAVASSS